MYSSKIFIYKKHASPNNIELISMRGVSIYKLIYKLLENNENLN